MDELFRAVLESSPGQRERLEEHLQEVRRMEAMGRLAGGVVHDFNNLLTVIVGRCEIMLDRLSGNHPMLPDVMLVHDAAQKAASVTRQLLTFGRKQTIQPRILDINGVVSGMKAIVLSLVHEKIQLHVELKPGIWRVEADLSQMEQVILNLIVNAIDAMSQGGELEIKTANETLDGLDKEFMVLPGPYAVLSVRDTGSGMDAETLHRIFQPFFTTKSPTKGTGLGLATVDNIVKEAGGYIRVISAPGQGTTFKIYLPGLDREAPALSSEKKETPRGSETILIVEDAHVVRKIIGELLENLGYRILEAGDGPDAIRLSETHSGPIDMLLTDVILPQMNGGELAGNLRKTRPGIKVLLMSGYADEIVRSQSGEAPDGFIAKPFNVSALGTKVRDALDSKRDS